MKLEAEQLQSALPALLANIDDLKIGEVEIDHRPSRSSVDFLIHVLLADNDHVLACEAKHSGQPRQVRDAVRQLRNELVHFGPKVTPVLIAPYLSPKAREICKHEKVGYVDLEGNAWLRFLSVLIDREVASKPKTERREIKSLFKPKAARILRVMLRDPGRAWRLVDLVRAARVSIGHVSNVRAALVDREWAVVTSEGVRLSDPNAVLDAWRDVYEAPGERLGFYTPLHGPILEKATDGALHDPEGAGHARLASYSAAQHIAPYTRVGTHSFYADEKGLEILKRELRLSRTERGENVVINLIEDDILLKEDDEPVPGIATTSPLQTYLDLWVSGERGREAADHLRRQRLVWGH